MYDPRNIAEQCTPLPIDSILPDNNYKTENKLYNIQITHGQIIAIISKLNSKKARGADNISTSMLKLWAVEVAVPLKLIFDKSL